MPPARSRPLEDSKTEPASHRERYAATVATANGRVKKNGNTTAPAKDAAGSHVNGTASENAANTTALNWPATPTSFLHQYRHAYALHTAPSFHSSLVESTLTNPHGIGRQSPTMIKRAKRRKKSTREQLAQSVRKHFNDLAVNETDVVIEFLYTVRTQKEALRQQFAPQKPK